MKTISTAKVALLLVLLLELPGLHARAQSQPPDPGQQPAPADSGAGAPPAGEEPGALPQTPQNDRTPVSGVEDYRLSGLNLGRSFVIGQLKLSEIYDNNSNSAAKKSAALSDSITNLHGSLALQFLSARNALDLDYSAAALFYAKGTFSQSTVQQLNVTEKFYHRRWTFLLGDDFSYLPQSAFGLGGLGFGAGGNPGIPGLGGGLTNYNPFFLPGQSIQSLGRRINNSIVGQGQYTLGPRASLNFSATYGLVHFLDLGPLGSRNLAFRFGYDYLIDAKQTLTVAFSNSRIKFVSGAPGFSSNSALVGYRRQLNGRMSLIADGGPQFSHFTNPKSGPATRFAWTLRTELQYKMIRNNIELRYLHHTTEGSGLLLGADTNTLQTSISRTLDRNWSGTLSGNFDRNSSLKQTTGATNDVHFSSWRGGVALDRRIGLHGSLLLQYTISRQTSNVTVCPGSIACGSVALHHQIQLGYNWSSRPYSIE